MTVQSTGRRTFFHARGANALLGPEHFDFAAEPARILHYGYLLLLDKMDGPSATHGVVAAEVLQRAAAAGMKVSIDCVSEDSDRFPRIVKPVLKHVDYCFMNEFEAGRVTGRRVRHDQALHLDELRQAMQALLDEGVRQRVIVHFPEGASRWAAMENGTSALPSLSPRVSSRGPPEQATPSPPESSSPGTTTSPSKPSFATASARPPPASATKPAPPA